MAEGKPSVQIHHYHTMKTAAKILSILTVIDSNGERSDNDLTLNDVNLFLQTATSYWKRPLKMANNSISKSKLMISRNPKNQVSGKLVHKVLTFNIYLFIFIYIYLYILILFRIKAHI